MAFLFALPQHLQVSIAILLARSGHVHVDPLMVTSKSGMELVTTPNVLHEVSFKYTSFQPCLVKEGFTLRPFIVCCAMAGNQKITYLEALKTAVHDGRLD